jgi:hypothetical protein
MNRHRNISRDHVAPLTLTLLLIGQISVANGQQAKQPSRSELQAELVRLRAALADCQNSKQTAKLNGAREDAIASLRAVNSALSTGANLEEFKRYQIESRIKVDALPNVPENREIRYVSDLYREAIIFGLINIADGTISATDLAAEKESHHLDDVDPDRKERAIFDKPILDSLMHMTPEEDIQPAAKAQAEADEIRSHTYHTRQDINRLEAIALASADADYHHKRNRSEAKLISQILLLEAGDRLSTLKSLK